MRKNIKHSELFSFLKSKVFPYIKSSVNDNDTAEEIFQTSFIKLHNRYSLDLNKRDSYNIMLRIVKNNIVDHFRKVKSSKTDLFSSFDSVKINEECYDYDIDEKVALIKKLSNNLTSKYKVVFDMFAVEGYEHSEISKELNINRGTSRSNFFKAKNKIKTQFELEYFRK